MKTLDITWSPTQKHVAKASSAITTPPQPKVPTAVSNFATRLPQAVQPDLGKSYAELDCYQLVVSGLKRLGISYNGGGGLKRQLVNMAKSQGRPANSYLNGEGLIKAIGAQVYAKAVLSVTDPKIQAVQVLEEIKPQLHEGQILSFSTPTKGHTGIISRKNGVWTFINSGQMDHSIEKRTVAKGVGEELLGAEIENWFKRAARSTEALQISLGSLNAIRLTAFQSDHLVAPQKV